MKTTAGIAFIYMVAALAGCGGGGAAVEPQQSTNTPPAETPTPGTPSTPSAPGATVVTTVGTSFSPASVTIAPGSAITWQIAGGTHNGTFGGTKPTGDDIPDTGAGNSVSRTFPTVGGNIPEGSAAQGASRTFNSGGDYDYHNSRNRDIKGRIRVR